MAVQYSPDDFAVSEWVDAGHVDIESRVDPPSLQADSTTRRQYRETLAAAVTQKTTRFLAHDVEVTLTWIISEARRYQTHIVADLDNVLKPTIDALIGPSGILFDDNQVQSIKASWVTGVTPSHRGFQLRVAALLPDDSVSRGGKFVEITAARCFYVPPGPPKAERVIADYIAWLFAERAEAEAKGYPEELLRHLEPAMRSFPRATCKARGFEVLPPESFG